MDVRAGCPCHNEEIEKGGGVRNHSKGGCKRLFAFVHVCSRFACACLRFRLCVCLRFSTLVCVCLRLLAFAYTPLCCAPVTLTQCFCRGFAGPDVRMGILPKTSSFGRDHMGEKQEEPGR